MDLDKLLASARALELSEKQASEIEKTETSQPNVLRRKPRLHKTNKRTFAKKKSHFKPSNKQCRNCGGEYPHQNGLCPAHDKNCRFCSIKGHFESCCRKKHQNQKRKTVNHMDNYYQNYGTNNNDNDSSEEEAYLFGLEFGENNQASINSVKSKQPRLNVKVDGLNVQMLVDTGSSINILDENTYQRFQVKPKLSKTETKVFTYGSNTNFPLLGKFMGTVESKDKITTTNFYATKGSSGCLLSYESAVGLQIIPEISVISSSSSKSEKLCETYSSIFEGIGKLKDVEIDMHVDPDVQPFQQPHRGIPFHVRKDVEKELEIMKANDLIEEVDEPTPWVSPIVVAPKPKSPNEVRICVDMREPNLAIKRTRHIIPTVDDIIVDLNGSKVFSKLDLRKGYNQLILSQSSRNITCFTTHAGIFRYKRLCFGINSAAEIFQNTLRNALHGLEGVKNISDDIIVFGKDQDEHDKET